MKNSSIYSRSKVSFAGLKRAFETERSFRTQLALCAIASAVLLYFRLQANALALWFVVVAFAVSLELVNAAVEALGDRINTEQDAAIGAAKDISSAAAFIANGACATLFAWMLLTHLTA